MKVYRGKGGLAPLVLNLGSRWWCVACLTLRLLNPGERAPIIARIEGSVDPEDGLKIFEVKILPCLPASEPRIVQPVA